MEKNVTILYVDDEPTNLALFEINFGEHYTILTAENGFSGLDVLAQNPDIPLIISDMKMPRMNGLEFITKANELYPDKKFYILTGYEITSEIQQSLNTGLIRKYFSKPLNVKAIDDEIRKATE